MKNTGIDIESAARIRQGDRVELHPATDAWMRGDRYGTVRKIGRLLIHVHMDRSDRVLQFHPDNILSSERPSDDNNHKA